jgi:hypothetical protein
MKTEVSSIYFLKSGNHQLRAIQLLQAAPLVQAAQLLLEQSYKGVLFKVRLIRKSFSTKLYRTYGKTKKLIKQKKKVSLLC